MLYPLSYEGLACTFAQDVGRVASVGLGQATSLPTVCAVPVPHVVDQLVITALARGTDCTAPGSLRW